MLAGKVVLVTGGGRGIGRAIALAAAQAGAAVMVADQGVALDGGGGEATPAEETAAAIVASGGKALASAADVTAAGAAEALVADAVATFGRIDAVVHCAGILRDCIWHRMSVEDWRAVMAVHLDAAFLLASAATPHMRASGAGSFVFMTSGAGLVGNVGQANYAAAKLGVVGLMQSIALDAARYGVRANAIAPVAWTRMIAQAASGTAPDPAFGAETVAPLAVYLCSDAASHVTNQVFGVQGPEISVYSRPRPVHAVTRDGGWSAEELATSGMAALAPHFTPEDATAAQVLADRRYRVQRV